MSDSVELRTLEKCTSQMEIALLVLERDFVHFLKDKCFIVEDVRDRVLDARSMLKGEEKAGELVKWIKVRVKQDSGSYHTLVNRLKCGGELYRPILKTLDDEYRKQEEFQHVQQQHPLSSEPPQQQVSRQGREDIDSPPPMKKPKYNETQPKLDSSGLASHIPVPMLLSPQQENKPDYSILESVQDELVPEVELVSTDFTLKLGDDYEERKYQRKLAEPGVKGENYIIVAPTGHGKTLVAAHVISDHLQKNQHHQSCHVVFIVNTRPLAEQQKKKLTSYIPEARVGMYTGDCPSSVKDSIKENNISVCTAGKLREEVRKGWVKFDQFSLMIFDECHHAAQKGDVYARLMERYLEYKEKNPLNDLPQIIGMTASPGAGVNYGAVRAKSIDHLVKLAAYMNATGGYHFVTNQLQKKHSCTRKILKPRKTSEDPFIDCIVTEMVELEALVPTAKNRFLRWSQAYGTTVQQLKESFEVLKDEKLRDDISTLDLLGCYYNALQVYMDLQQQDAIKEVENYTGFPEDGKATQCELAIKERWKSLLEQLEQKPIRANPLLDNMMETLRETFRAQPNSRALIFVPSKKHAYCVCNWLRSNHSTVHAIIPGVITGQVNQGMTQIEQEDVMTAFRTGKTNLLVATSVAQEGLDVPECNLVIRYQHVSNEIAQIQAEGRARAENSQGITILSSDSKKKFRELRNNELVILVEEILEKNYLPVGSDLEDELKKIQRNIVIKRHERVALKEQLRHSQTSDTVKLYCKRCKKFACTGSDIYLEGPHHVVPSPKFRKKIAWKEHKNPRDIVIGSVSKTHKVHCTHYM